MLRLLAEFSAIKTASRGSWDSARAVSAHRGTRLPKGSESCRQPALRSGGDTVWALCLPGRWPVSDVGCLCVSPLACTDTAPQLPG